MLGAQQISPVIDRCEIPNHHFRTIPILDPSAKWAWNLQDWKSSLHIADRKDPGNRQANRGVAGFVLNMCPKAPCCPYESIHWRGVTWTYDSTLSVEGQCFVYSVISLYTLHIHVIGESVLFNSHRLIYKCTKFVLNICRNINPHHCENWTLFLSHYQSDPLPYQLIHINAIN